MYLLDTNVISEAKRKSPEALRWFEKTRAGDHYICVVSLTEISKGAHMLDRKDKIRAADIFKWLKDIEMQFKERMIAVDQTIAIESGRVASIRTRGEMDCLIAAAAIVNGMTLVTRNVRDFADAGVTLVNPWAEA
jgi:toxin FitB